VLTDAVKHPADIDKSLEKPYVPDSTFPGGDVPERTNEDIIRIVSKYQNFGLVHELTCTVDSRHAALEPVERDGKVILTCPTCGAIQETIPEFVLGSEEMIDYSAQKWAEAHAWAERRHARQDVWFSVAASVIGSATLGSLWWGTPGGLGGFIFGLAVGLLATRGQRKSLSRP